MDDAAFHRLASRIRDEARDSDTSLTRATRDRDRATPRDRDRATPRDASRVFG